MRQQVWLVCALVVGCGEQHAKRIGAVETAPDAVPKIAMADSAAVTGVAADKTTSRQPSPDASEPWDLIHAACDAMSRRDEAAAADLLHKLMQDDQCVDCALALSATMAEIDERCPWTAAQRGLRLQLSRQSQRRLDAAHKLTRTLLAGSQKDLGAASAPVVALTIEHSLDDKVESYQLAPAALPAYLRDPGRPMASTVRLRGAAGTALKYESPAGITHSALFLDRVELDAHQRISAIWLIDGD